MPLYAVSHISWNDHELVTVFRTADDWKAALRQHPAYADPDYKTDTDEWFAALPNDQSAAKAYAFDNDSMIEVVEVPENKG